MKIYSLKPSRTLFILASLSALLHAFVIGTPWGSLYFAFIFTLFDIKFWTKNFFIKKSISLFTVYFLFIVIFYCFYAKYPIFFLYKMISIFIFSYYFCCGFYFYGPRYIHWGFRFSVIFALCQFIEANFSNSRILNAANFHFLIADGYWFGSAFVSEGSYAPHIIQGMMRVSSLAAEPGHFSCVLTALLPFVMSSKRKYLDAGLWLLGMMLCTSKVSLVQLPLIALTLVFGISGQLSAIFQPFLFILYFFGGLAIFELIGREELLRINASIFERFNGAYLFTFLDSSQKIFGTGWQRVCEKIPDGITKLGEGMSSFVAMRGTGQVVCGAGVHSSIGSFLLECGLMGCGILFLAFTYHLLVASKRINKLDVYHFRTGVLIFLLASLSVHYLTFFPSFYVLLGFLMMNFKKSRFPYLGKDKVPFGEGLPKSQCVRF